MQFAKVMPGLGRREHHIIAELQPGRSLQRLRGWRSAAPGGRNVPHAIAERYGKGDFVRITAQDRAMDNTDPADSFSLIGITQGGSNYGRWSTSPS